MTDTSTESTENKDKGGKIFLPPLLLHINYKNHISVFRPLFAIRDNELITLAVDVDNLDGRVVLEVFAQLGDVNIHAAGVEIIVINPDGLQCVVTLENFIRVLAEKSQQFAFLCGESCLLLGCSQNLLLGVKSKLTDAVERTVLALLAADTAEHGLNA